MSNVFPTVNTLERLRTLSEFSSDQLMALSKQLDQKIAKKGEILLELGATDDFSLFVLSGDIVIRSRDGKLTEIRIDEQSKLTPLAQLRPSVYEIMAVKKGVNFLKISKAVLTQLSMNTDVEDNSMKVEVVESDPATDLITISVIKDMMDDKLSLPSLPEIALKIQQIYQDDMADLNTIANILTIDPAISAKLIKIANSLVYKGEVPTDTLKAAISRLGMDTTYKQVMAYAVNDLFKSSSSSLKERMEELWKHSRKVAAISRLLAEETKLFNPELAMLAGLVHDLGIIVILEYLEQKGLCDDEDIDISKTIQTLRPVVTGMLMKKWNFSSDTIVVAEECEDWFRNPSDEMDLCDLVLLAQYHSFIGTEEMSKLPPINTIPAMSKLNYSAADSIALIKNSKDRIRSMEQMLN